MSVNRSRADFKSAIKSALNYAKSRAHTSQHAEDLVKWAREQEKVARTENRDWLDDWEIDHAKELVKHLDTLDTQRDGSVIAEGLKAATQVYSMESGKSVAYSQSDLGLTNDNLPSRNNVSTTQVGAQFTATSGRDSFDGSSYTAYQDKDGNVVVADSSDNQSIS